MTGRGSTVGAAERIDSDLHLGESVAAAADERIAFPIDKVMSFGRRPSILVSSKPRRGRVAPAVQNNTRVLTGFDRHGSFRAGEIVPRERAAAVVTRAAEEALRKVFAPEA